MDIHAPVAGRIADLKVERGARVGAGETIAVLEAMKMEHPVTATVPGVVTVVKVATGEAVDAGDLLVTLEPSESETGKEIAEETPDLAAQAELDRRVDEMAQEGRGINVAAAFEIDDVIDPADSRRWITTLLTA